MSLDGGVGSVGLATDPELAGQHPAEGVELVLAAEGEAELLVVDAERGEDPAILESLGVHQLLLGLRVEEVEEVDGDRLLRLDADDPVEAVVAEPDLDDTEDEDAEHRHLDGLAGVLADDVDGVGLPLLVGAVEERTQHVADEHDLVPEGALEAHLVTRLVGVGPVLERRSCRVVGFGGRSHEGYLCFLVSGRNYRLDTHNSIKANK